MNIKINPEIFEHYPDLMVGVVVAYDMDNTIESYLLKETLKKQQSELNNALTKTLLSQHSHIKAWREAHKKFGSKPKEYLPSVENLALRVNKGQPIRSVNAAVDCYNIISMKYLLPLGGEDLDVIEGDLKLAFATGQEEPVRLLGEKEARKSFKGEVIWRDAQGIICRRWNWKEADRTKLTQKTKNAVFVIEALAPTSRELLQDAVAELAKLLEVYLEVPRVSCALLTAEHPSVKIKETKGYVSLQACKNPSGKDWNIYQLALADEREQVSEETKLRIEKVEHMRAQGIDPWPPVYAVEHTCAQVLEEFDTKDQRAEYILAGRIMSMREHGKTTFADLQDGLTRLQLYFKEDILGSDAYTELKKFIDIGDILWVKGSAFRTKMGEVTLEVKKFVLLSKCLHPLPEKFHGLTDTEVRYRQRYLDLISNSESKKKFIKRSRLIRFMRDFLDEHGYLEVETPMLHPIAGGATARPFITHHNTLDSDFYLRIAPELYLKRLVIGGFDRVYEINRNFRNEGISTRHNPEFTMLEFYTAHHDYNFAMDFVESMLRTIILQACSTLEVAFGDSIIDFAQKFKRISTKEALLRMPGISQNELKESLIDQTLKKYKVDLNNKKASLGEKIFALFEKLIEPSLIQPTFIIDFPIEISPLAKRDPQSPEIAARFELFIGGMEISNGFNELNDPFDQAERFKAQLEAHRAGDEEAHQYDADYIKALEYALPPTVGVGIGIDRLVMLATNTTSIKNVILFPTLKKK